MKRLIKPVAILLVVFFMAVGFVWQNYVSHAQEIQLTTRQAPEFDPREINIGVIGESWAAGEKIDGFLIEALATKGISSTVISRGHPGAKSKFVYQNLFKPIEENFSSNEIITGSPLDFCIILTGINDTATYVGSNYYSHHIDLIVKALMTRGITPIVVEIPEYGIEITDSSTITGKIRRRLMRWVHDDNQIDVIPKYRQAAKEKLNPYIEKNQVIYFPFSSVSADYRDNKELYKEGFLYLNSDGNKKLAYELSKVITEWCNNAL